MVSRGERWGSRVFVTVIWFNLRIRWLNRGIGMDSGDGVELSREGLQTSLCGGDRVTVARAMPSEHAITLEVTRA